MSTVAAIFNSRADAGRAAARLREAGFSEDRVSLLAPGATQGQLDDVPTTETEQPGMGAALGGAVGGALGIAGGLEFGAAAASLLIPGVGPVFA
nr:histidine kinase [Acidobacteriota bacterium]